MDCSCGHSKVAHIAAGKAPTIEMVREGMLNKDIDSLPDFGVWLSRDMIVEGDEGLSWKGRAWYSSRQLVLLAETNWEDTKKITRITVLGSQLKEDDLANVVPIMRHVCYTILLTGPRTMCHRRIGPPYIPAIVWITC